MAGAGVEDHVHLHVVPRWNGDTNFMPVLADVKVMPEHLTRTAAKLRGRAGREPEVGPRPQACDSRTSSRSQNRSQTAGSDP